MKKKLLKTLALHKNAISNLNETTGGLVGADTNVAKISKEVRCVSAGPVICQTEAGYGHPCTWEICIYIF